MDTWVKLNNQTAGRDKLARLLQYLSRVLWHRLHQSHKDGVNNFKSLEYQLSTFRKQKCVYPNCDLNLQVPVSQLAEHTLPVGAFIFLKLHLIDRAFKILRFGRCFDTLYATLPLFQHRDPTVRSVLILSRISQALFLLTDHLLWLGRADVCTVDTNRWSRLSNKYWLYSITLNLVRDFYEISKIVKAQKCSVVSPNGNVSETALRIFALLQQNRSVVIDTVKNSCDFFIPLTALGHVKLSPGTVGWLGVISSLAGLLVLVEPSVKMSPS